MRHPDAMKDTDTDTKTRTQHLMTINEVADSLRCSRNHVYRLISEGSLKAVNISTVASARTKIRVTSSDLTDYLANCYEPLAVKGGV